MKRISQRIFELKNMAKHDPEKAKDMVSELKKDGMRSITANTLGVMLGCELYRIRDEVADLVNKTDIKSLPNEMPVSLASEQGFLVEAKRDFLFREVNSVFIARVKDIELNTCLLVVSIDSVNMHCAMYSWQRFKETILEQPEKIADALTFAVKLALLIESEGSPLVRSEPQDFSPITRKNSKSQFSVRYIKLSNRPNVIIEDRTPRTEQGEPLDKTGMIAEKVHVRGHLKMQVCGPKNSERKLIYVAPHTSTAWRNINRETRISA